MDIMKEIKLKKIRTRVIVTLVVIIVLIIISFVVRGIIINRENNLINKRIVNAEKNSIIDIKYDLSRLKLYDSTLNNMKQNNKKLQLTKNEAKILLNTDYLRENNKINVRVVSTNKYSELNNVTCIETDISGQKEKNIIQKLTVDIDKMNLNTEYIDIYAIKNNELIQYRLKEKIANNNVIINIEDYEIDKYIVAFVPVNYLTLNYEKIDIKKGEEVKLTYDINRNATITQLHARVVDPNIIELTSDGTIKAINAGNTSLIIQSYQNSVTKTIEVNVKEIPTEIKVDKEEIEIKEDETYELKIEVLPEKLENKKVILKSQNENIVKIMRNNVIKGILKGKTKITITTEETPAITKEINIIVKKKKVKQKNKNEEVIIEEQPKEEENNIIIENNNNTMVEGNQNTQNKMYSNEVLLDVQNQI